MPQGICLNTGRTHFKKGFTPWNKGKSGTYKLSIKIAKDVCICKNCNNKFEIEHWRLKDKTRGQFCTQKCFRTFNKGTNHYWTGKKRLDVAGKNNWKWKGGLKDCIDCGNQISTYNPKEGRCLLCSNRFRSGENSPHWRGGVSKLHKTERQLAMQTLEYKLWRNAVFERDNYKCISCNATGFLEADHIKSWADYPELRYAIDNGRTLCKPCHKKTDSYGSKVRVLRKENHFASS